MTVALLIQLAVSIAAVFAVAWGVRRLGLGDDARIRDADHAIALAEEAECGFGGVAAAVDRAGFAALVRNAAGETLILRAHGNHFAARLVDGRTTGRLNHDFLTLIPDDPRFGAVTLKLGQAAGSWAAHLRGTVRG